MTDQSPETRNGFSIGDPVRLPCMSTIFQVVGLRDPSLVELQAPDGRIVKAGWRTLIRIPTRQEKSNEHEV